MNTDKRFNSRKFGRCVIILITFQWSGPDHWYADVRRAYAQNGLYITFNNLPTIVGQQFTSYTVSVSHHVREQSLIPGEGDGGEWKEGPQKTSKGVVN